MKVSQETQDQHGKSIQNSQKTNGVRRNKTKRSFRNHVQTVPQRT